MQALNACVLGIVALALAADFYKDIKKAVSDSNTDSQSGSEE